ncbi:MAG: sigma-70 family RNA polymerase sigma factor [Patescibacteria group bacterium]
MKQQHMTQKFIDLHNANSDALFRYCYFRVSDREQAVDLVQETFLKLWDAFVKDSTEIKNARALLYKIASNLIIDWYRKKKAVSLDELLDFEQTEAYLNLADGSHEMMEIESDGKKALQYISKLEPTYQRVVYLRYVEDLSPKEIAEVVGLSVNVVSVRINRGIQELKKIYGLQ